MSTQPKPLSPVELECIRGRHDADQALARSVAAFGPPVFLRTMEDRSALLSYIAHLEEEAKKKDEALKAVDDFLNSGGKAMLTFNQIGLLCAAQDAVAEALVQTHQEEIEK